MFGYHNQPIHQQGRAADNDVPFQVRDTPQGIRVLIGEDDAATEWQGVLDLSWGTDPQPFFRVDRIDVNEGECGCVSPIKETTVTPLSSCLLS